MKDGEIAESGTHEELIALDSEYAKLYNIQADAFVAGSSAKVRVTSFNANPSFIWGTYSRESSILMSRIRCLTRLTEVIAKNHLSFEFVHSHIYLRQRDVFCPLLFGSSPSIFVRSLDLNYRDEFVFCLSSPSVYQPVWDAISSGRDINEEGFINPSS